MDPVFGKQGRRGVISSFIFSISSVRYLEGVITMLRVIIVDDEKLTREGLVEFVNWNKLGYTVVGQASDGLEGLELARELNPHLAICDVRMPRMKGTEMAQRILEFNPQCRIIFLSGFSDKDYLKSAIKLNAVDYLEKPLNILELSELLKDVRKSIETDEMSLATHDGLVRKIERGNQYLLDSIIERLIAKRYVDSDNLESLLAHMNIQFPLNSIYRIVTIKERNGQNIKRIIKGLKQKREHKNLSMIIGTKDLEIVIIHSHLIEVERISEFYNTLFEEINEEVDLKVEAGIGDKVYELKDIGQSYRSSIEAIEWRGFKNINRVVHNDENRTTSIIRDIEKYISNNYSQDLTINAIAERIYLTPQYLCKIYKKETGNTINNYITDLRMEKAIKLLHIRSLKLYEIADKLGYKDANYFARVFKKHYDMNPSDYRDLHNI